MKKFSLVIALILAAMLTTVVLAQQGNAETGRALFQSKGCTNCHPGGQAGVGPSLVGVTQRLSEDRIKQQINQGGGQMPPYPSSPQELNDLYAFLQTLSAQPPAQTPTAPPAATATPAAPAATPTTPAAQATAAPTRPAATATPAPGAAQVTPTTGPAASPTTGVAGAPGTLPRTGDSTVTVAAIGAALFGLTILGAGFVGRRHRD